MKLKSMMLVGAMIFFAAISASAQDRDESRVKIMPTHEAGIIKLLYAINTSEPLKVTFTTRNGQVGRDVIKNKDYPKGFIKHYDVKRIFKSDFWVEVSSPQMTLMYKVVPSKDGKSFTSHLEKSTYLHRPLVASNL